MTGISISSHMCRTGSVTTEHAAGLPALAGLVVLAAQLPPQHAADATAKQKGPIIGIDLGEQSHKPHA